MTHTRSINALIVALALCGVAPTCARTQTPDAWTPTLLLSPWLNGDHVLSLSVVDAVRSAVRRAVSRRELWVVPQSDIESGLLDWSDSVTYADIHEVGKVFRTDAIIDVGATRSLIGIHLAPIVFRGRHGDPEPLDSVDAPNIRLAADLLARRILADTLLRRSLIVARSKRPRVFTFSDPSGPTMAAFVVRDSGFFAQFGDKRGWMLPASSCIVNPGHPTLIQRRADLETSLRVWIDNAARRSGEAPPGIVTTLTNDTATVDGVLTARLRVEVAAEWTTDMWVTQSLLPVPLREASDRRRSMMPADYWRWTHGTPDMSELAFTYGIPLRVGTDGKSLDATQSDSVPPWIAQVERSCKAATR